MMRRTVLAALAAVGAIALASSAAKAAGGFSAASLSGSYAGIFSGRVPIGDGSLPILGTGVFIADGHGNLRRRETYVFGTTTCEATLRGSYTVSRDGRGENAITFTSLTPGCSSGSYTQSFVLAARGAVVLRYEERGARAEGSVM